MEMVCGILIRGAGRDFLFLQEIRERVGPDPRGSDGEILHWKEDQSIHCARPDGWLLSSSQFAAFFGM